MLLKHLLQVFTSNRKPQFRKRHNWSTRAATRPFDVPVVGYHPSLFHTNTASTAQPNRMLTSRDCARFPYCINKHSNDKPKRASDSKRGWDACRVNSVSTSESANSALVMKREKFNLILCKAAIRCTDATVTIPGVNETNTSSSENLTFFFFFFFNKWDTRHIFNPKSINSKSERGLNQQHHNRVILDKRALLKHQELWTWLVR